MAKRTVIAPDEELLISGRLTITGNVTQIETTQVINNFESNTVVINSDGDDVNSRLVLNSNDNEAVISFDNDNDYFLFNKDIQANITGNVSGTVTTANSLVSPVTITIDGDGSATDTFQNGGDTATLSLVLDTVNATTGSFGNASYIPNFTVNGKGLITAAGETAVNITSSQVSNFNTAISAYIIGGTALTESGGTISLDNTAVTPAAYGSASSVGTFTVDQQGRLTAAATTAINITSSQVSNFVTSSNSAIDARVTKTFVDALNVDADTLDSLNSLQFVRADLDQTLSNTYTFSGTLETTGVLDATSGQIIAVTQANTDNSSNVATTSYVNTRVEDLIGGAPDALDTLREISDSLANNTSLANTLIAQITSANTNIDTNNVAIQALEDITLTAGNGLVGTGTLTGDITFDVGDGDGISVSADSIAVDSTVVRTTGTQSIAGAKTFTGTLIGPTGTPTTEGAIYRDGSEYYAYVGGIERRLTGSDVGEVEDVGTGDIDIYAGSRTAANITYHGIKSISDSTYTTISEASNVITIDGNISAIRTGFSVTDTGGDGSLTYTASTGVFTYTGPSASEVRAHLSGTGLIGYDSGTGVISTTADNYANWKFVTPTTGNVTVGSDELVSFVAGTGITISNSGRAITITNSNTADITDVTAGAGLTGGGTSGSINLCRRRRRYHCRSRYSRG